MSGEKEDLHNARKTFQSAQRLFLQMRVHYTDQDHEIANLQHQFENYFKFAEQTTESLLANSDKEAINQSIKMNQLLHDLRDHIIEFRSTSYQNFLNTLKDARETSSLNFYMGIGVGGGNLLFMAILVFFIRFFNHQNKSVSYTLDQTATLLNNCGQGFFSFDADLKISGEYSQACLTLLGRAPIGLDADKLLFPYGHNSGKRTLMRNCINDALQAKTPRLAGMLLALIPSELSLNGRILLARYIPIKTGFMVVLTDITTEQEIKNKAELENKRSAMILAAVTEGPEFIALINDFAAFANLGAKPWLTGDIMHLYRAIHTFKGSFNQFRFTHVPSALHEIEAFLQDQKNDDFEDWIITAVFATDWLTLLNRDMEIVTTALGNQYFTRGGIVSLEIRQARDFEYLAHELLTHKKVKSGHERLLKELSQLRHVSLHKELLGFEKLLQQAALKLNKEPVRLEITGHDLRLDPDLYRPFLVQLGHVMRNAIDHGIEDPESRYDKGKPEFGSIVCITQLLGQAFELIIEDDGAGIDIDALRLRATQILNIKADTSSLTDLVFAEGLSSRDNVSEWSGRGVGMSAVRTEVYRLGGTLDVETTKDQGTRFIFRIPLQQDIKA